MVVIAEWTGKREILCLLLAHAHHTISQENNMQVFRLRNERKLILHVRGLTQRNIRRWQTISVHQTKIVFRASV